MRKEKLETLDPQEKELALEAKRLEGEIRAEKAQAGAAYNQIQTPSIYFTNIAELFEKKEKNTFRNAVGESFTIEETLEKKQIK